MSTTVRRSIFTAPLTGTLFLAVPAFALLGLAYFASGLRIGHALGMLLLFNAIPLIVIGVLGGTLLLLAFITVARSMRLTEPPAPRAFWALLPLIASLFLLACVGLAFVRGKKPIFDQTDAARLAELQRAQLDAAEATATDADWFQWRGPRRDGISRETALNLDWQAGAPPIVWKKPIRGGFSSITVAKGKLYATDRDEKNERVLCLDAATGEELWVYSYFNDYRGLEYGAGPRATPTVFDGRVYTVGATGTLLCLEAEPAGKEPKLLWRHNLMEEFKTEAPRWGVACSPLIEKDLVIVMPGGPNGSVAAVDRLSGDLVWKSLLDVGGYSSAIMSNAAGVRQVVCFTGQGLAGLKPETGEQLWYYPWETTFEGNIATPIVAGNYIFISSSYSKGCALLEIVAENGKLRAEPVYVKSNKLMRSFHSTCILHEGHLYGFDVITNNNSAKLKCIDFRTGEEKWADGSLKKGTLLFADGHLIIQTEEGLLAVVEATPAGFKLKGQFQLFDSSQTWALPSLSKGKLYVRDGHEVRCYDVKK
jgi:outer membrane protein assembly factor BamB